MNVVIRVQPEKLRVEDEYTVTYASELVAYRLTLAEKRVGEVIHETEWVFSENYKGQLFVNENIPVRTVSYADTTVRFGLASKP